MPLNSYTALMKLAHTLNSFILFSFLIPALTVEARIEVISTRRQSYRPDTRDCAQSDLCDLKRFRLVEQKKKVTLPNLPDKNAYYLTDIRAQYETTSLESIEKYGVVQLIRGCMFESTWDGSSTLKQLSISRNHMGENKIFKHPAWQIDNDHPAPVYTGLQFPDGRIDPFFLLNWNDNRHSLDANSSYFYGQRKPPHPVVYATDLPGPAFLAESLNGNLLRAQNTSLEFLTCLFKMSDLPANTDQNGAGIDFNKAIKCFEWSHKNVYDFSAKTFISSGSVDSVCLNPAPQPAQPDLLHQ